MSKASGSFGRLLQPEEAQEPILARPVRAGVLEWLTEIWAEEELAAVGLRARRRALFHGAPGTGKTTLAHHIAARLGLALAVVRPDHVIGRYMGTGIENVRMIFDRAEAMTTPAVLFFDELESIAAARMTSGVNQAAEHDHNAMINTLLTRLDGYDGFIIAATNHPKLVDEAVWRRFEIQVELGVPGQGERERILARYLDPFGLPKSELAAMAYAMETAAPALLRQFAEGLKRQIVVGPKAGWDMGREAVIARLVAACAPHPDLGLPRLWSLGAGDPAVAALGWPLRRSADLKDEPPAPPAEPTPNIIPMSRRRPAGGES